MPPQLPPVLRRRVLRAAPGHSCQPRARRFRT
jgi:hypothetical protein